MKKLRVDYILKIVGVLLLGLMIASCRKSSSSDDLADGVVPDDTEEEDLTVDALRDTEISFVVSTYNMDSSKVGYSNDNLPSEFELNITSEESAYTYKGVKMSHSSDGSLDQWSSDVTMYWADDTTPIEVEAFVPYKFTESDYTLQSDQSNIVSLEGCDLLYYHNSAVKPTANAVPIAFKHIMSKVYFKICLSNTGSVVDLSVNPISNVLVTGSGSLVTADLSDPNSVEAMPSLLSVSINPYTQASGECDFGEAYYTLVSESSISAYYETICVPQTIKAGELSMTLNVGDDKASWTSMEDYEFESGKIYVVTLNLALSLDDAGVQPDDEFASTMQVSSFSSSDWFSGENIVIEAVKKE